ncbi:MAG: hypothetical protein EBU08_17510 [Micrococcales bacterium]|nr:hypothetical protein [Micrococcales bacterium]
MIEFVVVEPTAIVYDTAAMGAGINPDMAFTVVYVEFHALLLPPDAYTTPVALISPTTVNVEPGEAVHALAEVGGQERRLPDQQHLRSGADRAGPAQGLPRQRDGDPERGQFGHRSPLPDRHTDPAGRQRRRSVPGRHHTPAMNGLYPEMTD